MTATAPTLVRTLRELMNNYVALLETVHPDLRVYRWRPRVPDVPCIWNWVDNAPLQQMDTGRQRDSIALSTYVVIRYTDVNDEMSKLEEYADAFREVIDQELYAQRPCGAKWAQRTTMRFRGLAYNDTTYLSAHFPMVFQIDRMIFSA